MPQHRRDRGLTPRERILERSRREEQHSPRRTLLDRIDPNISPDAFDPDPPTFRRGLRQGELEFRGSVLGARALGRQLLGDEEGSEQLQQQGAEVLERASEQGPRIQDVGSIESTEDFANFIIGGFGRVLPSAATAAAGGGVGGVVGRAAVSQLGKRAVSEGVKRSLRRRGARRGAAAGLGTTSVGAESGAIFAEAEGEPSEFSRTEQALLSLGGGTAAGALDFLPQFRVLNRVLPPGQTKRLKTKVLREASKQAGIEGITEASQEFIAGVTNNVISSDEELNDLLSKETLNEVLTGGALGIIGGGSLGGVSAAASRFLEASDVNVPGVAGEDVVRGTGRRAGRATAAVQDEIRKADNLVRSFFGPGQFERVREQRDVDLDAALQEEDAITRYFADDSFREAVEELAPDFDPRAPNANARLTSIITEAVEAAQVRREAETLAQQEDQDRGPDQDEAAAEIEDQAQTSETGMREFEGEPSRVRVRGIKGSRPEFTAPAQKPKQGQESTSFRRGLSEGEELVSYDQYVDQTADIPPNQRNTQQRNTVGEEEARTPAAKQAVKERVADRLLADLERRKVQGLEELRSLRNEDTNAFLSQFEVAVSEGPPAIPNEVELNEAQIRDIRQRGQQANPQDTRGFTPVSGVKGGKNVRLDPRALVKAAINSLPELRNISDRQERAAQAFNRGMMALIAQGEIDTFVEPSDNTVIEAFREGAKRPGITYGEIKTNDPIQRLLAEYKATPKEKRSREETRATARRIIKKARARLEKRNEFLSVIEDDLDGGEKKQIRTRLRELKRLEKEDPTAFMKQGGEAERIRLQNLLFSSRQVVEASQQLEDLVRMRELDMEQYEELGGEELQAELENIVFPRDFQDLEREIYDSVHEQIQEMGGEALPKHVYPEDRKGDTPFNRVVRRIKQLRAEIAKLASETKGQRTKKQQADLDRKNTQIEGLIDYLNVLTSRNMALSLAQKMRGFSTLPRVRVGTEQDSPVEAAQGTAIPADLRTEQDLKAAIEEQRIVLSRERKALADIKKKGGKGVGDRMREQGKKLRAEQDKLIALHREADDIVGGDLHIPLRVGDLEAVDFVPKIYPAAQRGLEETRMELKKLNKRLKYTKDKPEINRLKNLINEYTREERRLRSLVQNTTTSSAKDFARHIQRKIDFITSLNEELEEQLEGFLVGQEAEEVLSTLELNEKGLRKITELLERNGGYLREIAIGLGRQGPGREDALYQLDESETESFVKESFVKHDVYHGATNTLFFSKGKEANIFFSSRRNIAKSFSGSEEQIQEVEGADVVPGEEIFNNPDQHPDLVKNVRNTGIKDEITGEDRYEVEIADKAKKKFAEFFGGNISKPLMTKREAVLNLERFQVFLSTGKDIRPGLFKAKISLKNPFIAEFGGADNTSTPKKVRTDLIEAINLALEGTTLSKAKQKRLDNLLDLLDPANVADIGTDELAEFVRGANSILPKEQRFDGVIFKDIVDPGPFSEARKSSTRIDKNHSDAKPVDNYIVFNSDQVLVLPKGREQAMKESTSINQLTREYWEQAKKDINEYLQRTIGKSARFTQKLRGIASGQFDETIDAVYVSYFAHDPYSTAFHESLHYAYANFLTRSQREDLTAFFGKKKNLNRLIKAIKDTKRIGEKNKKGIIQIIRRDTRIGVEERAAYAYQLWVAGEFQPAPATNAVFKFLRKLLRDIFGIISRSERADLLFKALRDGELLRGKNANSPWQYPGMTDNAVRRAARNVEHITRDVLRPLTMEYLTPVAIWGEMHSNPVVRRMIRRFTSNPLSQDKGGTYMEKKGLRIRKMLQKWHEQVGWGDLSPQQQAAMRDAIYKRQTSDEGAQEHIAKWREFMDEFHQYMTDAGVEIGYLESYFPRVWSPVQIAENRDALLQIMQRHEAELKEMELTPEDAVNILQKADGVEAALPDIILSIAERRFSEKGLPSALAKELQGKTADQINNDIDEMKKREAQLEQQGGNEAELLDLRMRLQAYTLWANESLGTFTHAPSSPAAKERVFKFLDGEDLSPFLEQDFGIVMDKYIATGVKRAEFVREFGEDGRALRKARKDAIDLGLSTRDIEVLDASIAAMRGTLGTDMNPTFRKVSSALIMVQNLAILSLTSFTAMGDTAGILMRSQDVRFFWNGIRSASKAIAEDLFPREEIKKIKKRVKELESKQSLTEAEQKELVTLKQQKRESIDSMRQIAIEVGAIGSSILHTSLNERYSHEYLDGKVAGMDIKTVNDTFFRWIGLEYVTNLSRVAATSAGVSFIKSHTSRALEGNKRSKEFLAELNLKPEDIVVDEQGDLVVSKAGFEASGLSKDEASSRTEKMAVAINRFVDQAVPRPHAGDRPAQLSNPNLMLIAHLKSFIFTFQTQMLNRVGKQALQGNFKPAMFLMAYIPVMMAIDSLRLTVQYWWDEPDWDDDWTPMDHVGHAAKRGGLLGMAEFAVDMKQDYARGGTGIEALGGPSVETGLDMMRTVLVGYPDVDDMALRMTPGQNLYKNWPIWPNGYGESETR